MSEPNEKTTNGNLTGADEDLERLLNETAPDAAFGADEKSEDAWFFGVSGEELTEEGKELEDMLNEMYPDGMGADVVDVEALVDEAETAEVSVEDIKKAAGITEDSEEVVEKAEEASDDIKEDIEKTAEVAEVSEEDIEKAKEAEPEDIKEKEPFNIGREILEWFESLVFALLVVQLVLTFLLRIVMVDGESMTNTLQNGDRLIMTHVAYEPERDDIVVLDSSGANKVLIKRVIGIAGDKVKVDYNENHVYVNGEQISNEHIREVMEDSFYFDPSFCVSEGVYEYEVPDNCVFVMGDNRNDSKDSRSADVRFVDKSEIMGKAIFRVYPFNSICRVD